MPTLPAAEPSGASAERSASREAEDGPSWCIADHEAEQLPLRIDAAILLDQTLRLKGLLEAQRETAGPRILSRLRKAVAALRGAGKPAIPSASSKRRQSVERCAAVLLKSGLFDAHYYLLRNPEVAAAGLDPVHHYIERGASELRDPGPYFSTRWYVKRYPDVAASGKNPLHHFIVNGYAEGRRPRPTGRMGYPVPDLEGCGAVYPNFGLIASPSALGVALCAPTARAARLAAESIGPTPSNARLVVYSAMFGNYDELFVPPPELAQACDFVIFSDQPSIPPPWRRGPIVYAGPSNTLRSRFCKLLPHRLFPEYEWSLYLDANVDLRVNPNEFLERYRGLGPDFFVFRHPKRATIVEELAACIEGRKGNGERMTRQVAQYLDGGFRHSFPVTENNVLLRRHNDPDLADLGEAWWEEVRGKSGRDQLSLPYVIEKKNYRRIALFDDGWTTGRDSSDFEVRPHRHQFHLPSRLDGARG
ncbi:MAG TPA: glycosyltransferase domain-containing protein [Dongiaceae bacterium]